MNKVALFLAVSVFIFYCCSLPLFPKTAAAAASSLESFESESALANWTTVGGGSLEISAEHAKVGSHSMKWTFTQESRLHLSHYTAFQDVESNSGGLKIWIYNTDPVDKDLIFTIGEESELQAGNPRYKFTFHLNFKGWRALWIKNLNTYAVNPDYTGTKALDALEIQAPSMNGSLYFDAMDSSKDTRISMTSDNQVPYLAPGNVEYQFSLQQPTLPEETQITEEQKAAFRTITQRLDDYLYPRNIHYAGLPDADPLKIRYNSLQKSISGSGGLVARYDKYGIHRDADGNVRGPGLFSASDPLTPKFNDFEKVWIGLLSDYKLNGNAASKQKLFDLFDFFNDQGFAAGSALGAWSTIDDIRMDGYAYAVYMMRDELKATGRLDRELATLRWRTTFGITFNYDPKSENYGFSADKIRSVLLYQLMYILMLPDSPEKVRYMKGYLDFYHKLAAPVPGFKGGIKPGDTIYHHDGVYMGSYGAEAIMALSEVIYLLNGTCFAVDQEATDVVKQVLQTYRISSNTYSLPAGLNGRMAENNSPMLNIMGAYAFLGAAGDRGMAEIFLDLWNPQNADVRATYSQATNSINYFTTLGQIDLFSNLVKQAKSKGYQAAAPPSGNWVKPYGGYAVHRRGDWMVATKGWSAYIWDFEIGIDGYDENVYGRYTNYGTTLILNRQGSVGSGIDTSAGWDWNRWPGSTTKHLPFEQLKADSVKYRNFSDETFLGGVSSEGMDGVFAMRLHDTSVDPSFRANKSWFYFGNEVISLGSDIVNDDAAHSTETTLFQSNIGNNKLPYYYNSTTPITAFPDAKAESGSRPVWLIDPYGNGYILPDASGLRVERGTQQSVRYMNNTATTGNYTTAWIDHGKQPVGASYEYVIVPQTTPAEVAAKAVKPDYKVLRKDQSAHIVMSQTLNAIGYVLFDAQTPLNYGLLKKVSAPSIVMERRKSSEEVIISAADPDLRLAKPKNLLSGTVKDEAKPSEMKKLQLEIEGIWKFRNSPGEGIRIVAADSGTNRTILEIDSVDGRTFEADLVTENFKEPAKAAFSGNWFSSWIKQLKLFVTELIDGIHSLWRIIGGLLK